MKTRETKVKRTKVCRGMVCRNMNRKGVGVGQVFIFIIAAVTFALVMIFGYRAINGFLQSGEDVTFVQFKNDLEGSIKKIYTEYGAVRIEEFTTPASYEQICFVNFDHVASPEEIAALCTFDQGACTAWQQAGSEGLVGSEENVFLKPVAPVKIKVYAIGFPDSNGQEFLCVPINNGHFSLALEGRGDHTRLTIPERE